MYNTKNNFQGLIYCNSIF